MDGSSAPDAGLADEVSRLQDADEVCDACFLECVPTREKLHGGYPCSKALREWAREHRYETDYYYEEP